MEQESFIHSSVNWRGMKCKGIEDITQCDIECRFHDEIKKAIKILIANS